MLGSTTTILVYFSWKALRRLWKPNATTSKRRLHLAESLVGDAREADFGDFIEHHGRAMVGTDEEVIGECLELEDIWHLKPRPKVCRGVTGESTFLRAVM